MEDKYPIKYENVEPHDILIQVKKLKDDRFRLVQICCTRTDDNELTYSFDKNYELINLRIILKENQKLSSICDFYKCAFLYENEIHDLFGIKFTGMKIDYGGKFYKTKEKFPFSFKSTVKK